MTIEPEWIGIDVAICYHEILILRYGGQHGLADRGLLESALDAPRNVYQYESQDLVVLAATYAHAIAKNHAFVDGNKRIAWASARVFLKVNGVVYDGDKAEAVVMVEGLASGGVDRDTFASWLRKGVQPR